MSHQRKTNNKKPSSSGSSENHHLQNIEQPLRRMSQPSTASSLKRPIYPNVPKRTRQPLSIDDDETIDTESRIDIIPSTARSSILEGYSSIRSSSTRKASARHTLDLITKYTSPKKTTQQSEYRPLSPIQNERSVSSNNQSVYGSKYKRALSPLDESDQQIHESKRPKSFDDGEEDDDEELSELIDHRRNRSKSSQISNASISSQKTNDGEQRKPTARKPTARKLGVTHRNPSASQPTIIEQRVETLIIEPDVDLEEETSWLTSDAQMSGIQREVSNRSISTPIIPSPIKLPIDNCIDSINSNSKQNSSFTPIEAHTPRRSLRQLLENPVDTSSPRSNQEAAGRRFSSTSSTSLLFDTPNSSFSRTTTNNTTSTPQPVMKTDRETQIFFPSNIDMINELIYQMNLTASDNEASIDYNPSELSGKLLKQCSLLFTNDKYPSTNLLPKKQFLNVGRHEMEILFSSNENKNATIYVCDVCLKHFPTSEIAFQRHTAKCLHTQPPGKLVLNKDNLAIFQIGDTNLTISQRIYLKSLCRIARFFTDPSKTIDDTKIDRFIYYILCRRDPILSSSQPSIYRLIGYFSKQLHQHAQPVVNNLSRLFVLPSFTEHQQYHQLLIAFSYSLIRSNRSTDIIYSSPARPLETRTLSAFRGFWRDLLSAYLVQRNHSSSQSLALDTFARQTSIHPRDILSSLYSAGLLVRHPADTSSVYLHNNAYRSMTSLNLPNRNKFLLLDMHLIDTNDEKRMLIDKPNFNKSYHTDAEEIVLD